MIIHVVQSGESILTIADKYQVPAERILLDNGINSNQVVVGQALIILFPVETYTVKEGDTLESIAASYHIQVSQLLRNNNYLINKASLVPGERIVISYKNDKGPIDINGFVNYLTDRKTLELSLPYLTYLSVFGYSWGSTGEFKEIDDLEIISKSKVYGVAPLILISAVSIQGSGDIQNVYNFLMNNESVDNNANSILSKLKNKGYYGVNIYFQYINQYNLNLYINYVNIIYERIHKENYKIFISIPPSVFLNLVLNVKDTNINIILSKIDGFLISDYKLGQNTMPPGPVTSITDYHTIMNQALKFIEPNKLYIGCPLLAYGWELPYIEGLSTAISLKLNTSVELAKDKNSPIEFDEPSQTPYFYYTEEKNKTSVKSVVWSIDARTIDQFLQLTLKYSLKGTGTWNIMYYYAPLWSVINSQFKINKLLPEI